MAIRTFFGSVKLKNEGAVARDHLANERTFLAWLRTSLAFASIGVAVTQFFRLQSETNALMTTLTTTRDGLDAAALPVAGLMSDLPPREVAALELDLMDFTRRMGCPMDDPFLALASMGPYLPAAFQVERTVMSVGV